MMDDLSILLIGACVAVVCLVFILRPGAPDPEAQPAQTIIEATGCGGFALLALAAAVTLVFLGGA